MLVRSIDEIRGTDGEVNDGDFVSRRLVLSQDGMGYSVHDTEIPPNSELHMWYKHHLETVLCMEGEGEIEDLSEGGVHKITPGVLYALNDHQKHILRSGDKGLRLFCVFNPPLVGAETHQEDGSYQLLNEDGGVIRN